MRRGTLVVLALCVGVFVVGVTANWWWNKTAVTVTAKDVSVDGVTLASQTIALHDDRTPFPAGAAGALLTRTCTGCHSPEMILNQPVMPADNWAGEVDKMRKTYKAPVDPADDAKIVAALVSPQPAR
ncbi:MAG: hypothetical protein M3R41_00240 [Pseudomonadota bacterium]|nr:hypothetical protein [Pseudomonadota bacterium]